MSYIQSFELSVLPSACCRALATCICKLWDCKVPGTARACACAAKTRLILLMPDAGCRLQRHRGSTCGCTFSHVAASLAAALAAGRQPSCRCQGCRGPTCAAARLLMLLMRYAAALLHAGCSKTPAELQIPEMQRLRVWPYIFSCCCFT